MIDPALFEQDVVPADDPMQLNNTNGTVEAPEQAQQEEESIEVVTTKEEANVDANEIGSSSGPTETVVNAVVKEEPDTTTAISQPKSATGDTSSTAITQEVEVDAKHAGPSQTPRTSFSPVQRHSSRQPKQVERYIPDDSRSPTKALPKPARDERRGSSATSGQTMVNSVKSRRSSSNTSGTTHQVAAMMNQGTPPGTAARPVSRGSTAESDLDPDEQLARELQAEEHGLRRRQSMRL